MKERPILFQGAMVRAILAGTKTQTRLAVKPQPEQRPMPSGTLAWDWHNPPKVTLARWVTEDGFAAEMAKYCPYGQPGDRLAVRETWQYADWTDDGYPWIGYQADGAKELIERGIPEEWGERLMDIWADLSREANFNIDKRAADRRWRPSIHMPRWASRIKLEITAVRVERLQAISEADATAEGIVREVRDPGLGRGGRPGWRWADNEYAGSAVHGYELLWNSINGPGSWDANPWVWVVEFKRTTGAA